MKRAICLAAGIVATASTAMAEPVYLNRENISVRLGEGTAPGSMNNTFASGTIEKVIDAPSARAEEFHTQATHIWFTAASLGGALELIFEFPEPYNISTLHIWNYTSEDYDVDRIAFTFFGPDGAEVGALRVMPDLGSNPGIRAQDIPLAAPLNVARVRARLSGTNRQVDFQNIGFTAIRTSEAAGGGDCTISLQNAGDC